MFGAYCLLASAAWIVAPFGAGAVFYEQQVILFAVVCVGAIAFCGGRLRTLSRLPWIRLTIAGVGFWGIPACLIHWAGSGLPSIVISATFALLPVVVALVVSSTGGNEEEGRESIAPALAAFGGVLLLLPVGLPGSVRGQLMLAVTFAVVVLVAVSGVWMYRLMQGIAVAEAMVIVCFANAVFLGICSLAAREFEGGWGGLTAMLSLSSCVDLIQIVLVFWLLREMTPVRFGARYLVIPLLTVVEGYVVLRPEVTARMIVGFILLTGGAMWILLSKSPDTEVAAPS